MKNVEIKLVHSPDLSSPTIEFEEGNESKRFTNIEEAKKHLKEKQSKATDADIDEKIKMVISSNQSADLTIIDTIGIDERKTQSLEVVRNSSAANIIFIILFMLLCFLRGCDYSFTVRNLLTMPITSACVYVCCLRLFTFV